MRGFGILLAISCVAVGLWGCNGNSGSSPMNSQPGLSSSPGGSFAPGGSSAVPAGTPALRSETTTESTAGEPGGVAIWVNREDRTKSRILGLDSAGVLTLFALDGKKIVDLPDVKGASAIDVEYDVALSDRVTDLSVIATESKLLIYSIDPASGKPTEVSGKTEIFGGEEGDASRAAGLALYRQGNGDVFAFVAPKSGPVAQYRLVPEGGKFDLELVRRVGSTAQALAVDDELGIVYLGSESGIAKYSAAPDAANEPVAIFGASDAKGIRDGLTLLRAAPGEGFLATVDRTKSESRLTLYTRRGPNDQDDTNKLVRALGIAIGEGAGIAASTEALGPEHPTGIVVVADRANKRYAIFDWRSVQTAISSR